MQKVTESQNKTANQFCNDNKGRMWVYGAYTFVTWQGDCNGRKSYSFILFYKKQKKAYLFRGYYDKSLFISDIKGYVNHARIEAERIAKDEAKYKELCESLKAGEIFVASWGWEQTNVNFYEIVKRKGKSTLILREIAKDKIYTASMQGNCTPKKGQFIGDEFEKRLTKQGTLNFETYKFAQLWDGKPEGFSEYA